MPFKSPTPPILVAWFPENAHEIPQGIADITLGFFHFIQDSLKAHDLPCFSVATFAGSGFQECQRQFTLRVIHFLQSQAFPGRVAVLVLERHEMPPRALG